MAYCVLSDILDKVDESNILQLVKTLDSEKTSFDEDEKSGVSESVESKLIKKAIAAAELAVNRILRDRIPQCPFEDGSVPQDIVVLTADIAIHNLYQRHNVDEMPENVLEMHYRALKDLRRIASGEDVLSIGADSQPVRTFSNKTRSSKILNAELMGRY